MKTYISRSYIPKQRKMCLSIHVFHSYWKPKSYERFDRVQCSLALGVDHPVLKQVASGTGAIGIFNTVESRMKLVWKDPSFLLLLLYFSSLNAKGDGDSNQCDPEDHYIMSEVYDEYHANHYLFSSCSIQYFENWINTLNMLVVFYIRKNHG